MLGPKREETTGSYSKLHNEELHNFYSSPYIRMIKSKMIRWAADTVQMRQKRNVY